MSIQCDQDNQVIRLTGVCSVEESEDLLQLLDDTGWPVDVSELKHMHTACLQVLLLRHGKCRGQSPSPELQQLLLNSLTFETN